MLGQCTINPLSEDVRRALRPYVIVTLSAYLGGIVAATGMILWACLGHPTSPKLLAVVVVLPALIRHFGVLFLDRRRAELEGQPLPQTSLRAHVFVLIAASCIVILPWL